MKYISVEGGSTAYGMFDYEHGGWARRLQIDSLGISSKDMTDPLVVQVDALPGRTLSASVRNIEKDAGRLKHLGNRPGALHLIVSAGINEAKILKGQDGPAIPEDRFYTDLGRLGELASCINAGLVLVGPQPVDERVTRPIPASGTVIEDDLVEHYGETMAEFARENGFGYVDTRALFTPYQLEEVLDADGRHPNPLGHSLIYAGLKTVLAAHIPEIS